MEDSEVKEWASSRNVAKNIAASLAAGIKSGRLCRWNELPDNAALTKKWATSLSTVTRAKRLLADRGIIQKEGSRYFVA
jgi:DNA-binding GntR family transcriptional regulator